MSLKVAFFPNTSRINPYLNLLERGLVDHDVSILTDVPARPYLAWTDQYQGDVNILHFHWIEGFYNYKRKIEAHRCVAILPIQLIMAKHRNMRIVWTMHNVFPHERNYPKLDYLVWSLMAKYSDSVIVHCSDAKQLLATRWRRNRNVYVIHHGNYLGILDQHFAKDQDAARASLGLDKESQILLFFGALRPYKGLEGLIRSFASIEGPNIYLIVAGKPYSDKYRETIVGLCKSDRRIICCVGWQNDDDLALLIQACDAVILPFHRVQTSGSAILAMSCGRPVIAPAIGCLTDIVDSDSGILYKHSANMDLSRIILNAFDNDLVAMGVHARVQAKKMSWSAVARLTMKAYLMEDEE